MNSNFYPEEFNDQHIDNSWFKVLSVYISRWITQLAQEW